MCFKVVPFKNKVNFCLCLLFKLKISRFYCKSFSISLFSLELSDKIISCFSNKQHENPILFEVSNLSPVKIQIFIPAYFNLKIVEEALS